MDTAKANYATCMHCHAAFTSAQYKGMQCRLLGCLRLAYVSLTTVL